MPTTIKDPDSGQVKYAQDWELDSYKEQGWTVDEAATQDADGVNKNPDSGNLEADMADDGKPNASDPKADWEAYAAAQGVDTDGMTKAEIIDAVS